MRSRGGKGRFRGPIGRLLTRLADVLSSTVEDRCCGSLAVTRGVFDAGGKVSVAVDANVALMCTYKAVRDGWIPPQRLTREEYSIIHHGPQDPNDPMTAFAMLFCAYGGKWGSGYLPDDNRWPGATSVHAAAKAHADLLRMRPLLEQIDLRTGDCRVGFPRKSSVLYFDPPYLGTEAYACVKPFPHSSFLQIVEAASEDHAVVISEFTMPEMWREVAAMIAPCPGLMKTKTERLFVLRGGMADHIISDVSFRGIEV